MCEISRARVFSSRDVPVPPMTPPRRAARVRALRDRLSLLSKYRIEDRPLLFVFVCLFYYFKRNFIPLVELNTFRI